MSAEAFVAEERESASKTLRSRTEPLVLRQWLSVLVLVITADLWLYRGDGLAGVAAFLSGAMLLFGIACQRRPQILYSVVVGALLVGVVAKLLFDGSGVHVLLGFIVLATWCVTMLGRAPDLIDSGLMAITALPAGTIAAFPATRRSDRAVPFNVPWIAWLLPLIALVIFGGLFVLANPDIRTWFGESLQVGWERVAQWLERFQFTELLFWLFVAVLSLGMMRPLIKGQFLQEPSHGGRSIVAEDRWISAYRNTLVAVIALFSIYLVFEFFTLFRRDFPEGFYYAGYAHEGAAWLTVALALATVVLSVIFRSAVRMHPRARRLERLGWLWSLENLLLAVAVYNRMLIYIDFNGMTRMRTVGLFGITAVVVGFALVLRKIARGHSFAWLIRRQLWTLGVTIVLFAILPVDMVVHAYNARRVVRGDLAPSVQVIAHPISRSGYLVLPALLDSDNSTIRNGVLAMLAEEEIELSKQLDTSRGGDWKAFQLSDVWLSEHLSTLRPAWQIYRRDAARREEAIEAFREYAWQWY